MRVFARCRRHVLYSMKRLVCIYILTQKKKANLVPGVPVVDGLAEVELVDTSVDDMLVTTVVDDVLESVAVKY